MTRTRAALAVIALAIPFSLATAAPAQAITYSPMTWAQLQLDVAVATADDVVALGDDIVADTGGPGLVIAPGGTLVLDLNGHTLTIAGLDVERAGVRVPPTSTLIVEATGGGSLISTAGNAAAGIGGDYTETAGTVTITGGIISATGGLHGGAGIGGGANGGNGGTVTITGGTVTATGGRGDGNENGGSGIGGGGAFGPGGTGGTVIITGGTVSATGGAGDHDGGGGSGIGGGGGHTGGGAAGAGVDVQATATAGSGTTGGAGGDSGVITGGTGGSAALLSSTVTPPGVSYSANTTDGITIGPDGTGGSVQLSFHYLVSFDTGGGSAVAAQTVDGGDRALEPGVAPSRAGYQFTGWRLGSASGDLWDFATPITSPTVLVAGWQQVIPPTGVGSIGPLSLIALLLLLAGAALTSRRPRHS